MYHCWWGSVARRWKNIQNQILIGTQVFSNTFRRENLPRTMPFHYCGVRSLNPHKYLQIKINELSSSFQVMRCSTIHHTLLVITTDKTWGSESWQFRWQHGCSEIRNLPKLSFHLQLSWMLLHTYTHGNTVVMYAQDILTRSSCYFSYIRVVESI